MASPAGAAAPGPSRAHQYIVRGNGAGTDGLYIATELYRRGGKCLCSDCDKRSMQKG